MTPGLRRPFVIVSWPDNRPGRSGGSKLKSLLGSGGRRARRKSSVPTSLIFSLSNLMDRAKRGKRRGPGCPCGSLSTSYLNNVIRG